MLLQICDAHAAANFCNSSSIYIKENLNVLILNVTHCIPSPSFVTFASLCAFSLYLSPFPTDVNSNFRRYLKFDDGSFVPFFAKEGGSRNVFGSFYKLNENNKLCGENIVLFPSFWFPQKLHPSVIRHTYRVMHQVVVPQFLLKPKQKLRLVYPIRNIY